jgi:biotin carboxyl carrier protein
MNDGRGRLRLLVEGPTEESFGLDPAELGPPPSHEPQVRALPRSAADRAAGLLRFEGTVDGWVMRVTVEDEARALLRERAAHAAESAGGHGSDVVRAQIPGRVVRLWVEEGDTVEAGQRLLAIEAMKMENEVRSPRAGTVEAIHVTAGRGVELRDELITVTSSAE